MSQEMGSFVVNKLKVRIFKDRKALGQAAGEAVAEKMREMLQCQKELFVVFAAAPSQNEFLEELGIRTGVGWGRVAAFHLDEYLGLPDTAPQSFGHFLRESCLQRSILEGYII
jgi:glucosamine-6-phosphate deaminase